MNKSGAYADQHVLAPIIRELFQLKLNVWAVSNEEINMRDDVDQSSDFEVVFIH
jgi:hypothetical protein